jgi:hypothetical protein
VRRRLKGYARLGRSPTSHRVKPAMPPLMLFALAVDVATDDELTTMEATIARMPVFELLNDFDGRRQCECTCDVHSCSPHSAHANLTISMQLHTRQRGLRRWRNRRL